jgi:hypothetical protein
MENCGIVAENEQPGKPENAPNGPEEAETALIDSGQ